MTVKQSDPAAQHFIRICAQIIADATRRAAPLLPAKPGRKSKIKRQTTARRK